MFFKTIYLFFMVIIKGIVCAKCPDQFISRDEWGARPAIEVTHLITPVEHVIIHHTVTPECFTVEECIQRVYNTQIFHMENEDLGYNDIGYNFLIGSDGNVYEGTGWHNMGSHTYGYNSRSVGIGFIGTFNDKNASPAAIAAAKKLLECGVSHGTLHSNYKLLAGRQILQTQSPGLRLFREMKNWRGWTTLI